MKYHICREVRVSVLVKELNDLHSNKCILFWRTRPALQSEGVGSQWTQHQSSTGLHIIIYIYVSYTIVNAWSVGESTTQVAVGGGSMVASHVCTLVNVLVVTRKTPPVQVAGGAHRKCK